MAKADTEVKKDTAEELVTVRIPRERNDKEDSVYVCVNDRDWLIKKGVEVQIPRCAYEVLMRSQEQREAAYDFIAANKDRNEK